jgi:GDP-4-dehydro-6-deoxy-D-mannose reductase
MIQFRETQPFRPSRCVSKAAQDLLGYRCWKAANLHIVRTRSFNIIGPRHSTAFVGSAFARQVAEIEHGLREPIIEVGNLDAVRDFVDVRDVARAYWLALEHGQPGQVYNVCTGQGRRIRAVLEGLLALSTVQGIQVRQTLVDSG